MQKWILQFVKATFLFVTIISTFTVYSQQNIIADKDNTHPEQTSLHYAPARITIFSVVPQNGFNEIQWSAMAEQDTRRYIVEYSADGIHYTTAGEVMPATGMYNLKHTTNDERSLLYRIRIEKKDGRYFTSADFLLEGINYPPVKIYPTILSTNLVNLEIYFPVQRINIISPDGRLVFARDMSGFRGNTSIVIPASLPQGIYLVNFYGNGWKNTQRIIIGR